MFFDRGSPLWYNTTMKIIRESLHLPVFSEAPFRRYFDGLKVGVFDIETTGLSPSGSRLILSGFLISGPDGAEIRQYFAESLWDEEEVLARTLATLDELDLVVTYNGKGFDIPFVDGRRHRMLPHYGAEFSGNPDGNTFRPGNAGLPYPYNLDLYTVVRKYSPIRQFLPNLKQKTLEDFMGLWEGRSDRISGGESASLYMDYLINRDPDVERMILLHNRDDVVQLARLLRVLEKTEIHKAMYHLGFPVSAGPHGFHVERIDINGNGMSVQGLQRRGAVSHACFDSLLMSCGPGGFGSWDFSEADGRFRLDLTPIAEDGLVLMDLRALGMDESEFTPMGSVGSGYVVLKNHDEINYAGANLLVTRLLERIPQEWI